MRLLSRLALGKNRDMYKPHEVTVLGPLAPTLKDCDRSLLRGRKKRAKVCLYCSDALVGSGIVGATNERSRQGSMCSMRSVLVK